MERDAKHSSWRMSTQEALEGEVGGSWANKENLFWMLCMQTSFCLILYLYFGFVEQSPGLHSCRNEKSNNHILCSFYIFYLCLPNQRLNLITKAALSTAAKNTVKSPKLFSWWQVKQLSLFAVSTNIYQTRHSSVIPSLCCSSCSSLLLRLQAINTWLFF